MSSLEVALYIQPDPSTLFSQSTPQPFFKKISNEQLTKINKIFLKTIIAIVAFLINPTLSAISFFVSLIFSEQAERAIKKIENVWNNHSWAFVLIGGLAAFLSLQVTLAAVSVLVFTNLGSQLGQDNQHQG